MEINVNAVWLIAALLAFVRAVAWLVVVPPFQSKTTVPRIVLIGVAAGLAILSAPQVQTAGVPTDTAGLIGAVVLQVVIGVSLGFSVQILLSTISSAGTLVDLFGGINPPPAMDPLSENQMPILGQFYEQIAIVLLFVTNGELLLVRGFEASFGVRGFQLSSGTSVAQILVSDLATFFVAALEIAAPILVVLFATQIGLAMLSKAVPQLNAWWLGLPLQIVLSLVLVGLSLRVLPGYMSNLLARAVHDMTALIGLH